MKIINFDSETQRSKRRMEEMEKIGIESNIKERDKVEWERDITVEWINWEDMKELSRIKYATGTE